MAFIISMLRNEPARVFAVIEATLLTAMAFGLHITATQEGMLLTLAAALLGKGELVRSMVVPIAKLGPKEAP